MKKLTSFLIIGLTAVLVMGGVVLADDIYNNYYGNTNVTQTAVETNDGEMTLGAQSGPDHYQTATFYSSMNVGGSVWASSTVDATETLGAKYAIKDDTYLIKYTPNINATLTTMATSAMYWLGSQEGMTKTFMFQNASTTVAATVTLAAGTGVDLQEDEGETVAINGLEYARLTFMRRADTDVMLWVEVSQVGD